MRSRAQNDYFLVPHVEIPGSNLGRGKQLVFFKVSSNWLLYYNKSEFNALEIHDAALKV